jgi:hypothetical protein
MLPQVALVTGGGSGMTLATSTTGRARPSGKRHPSRPLDNDRGFYAVIDVNVVWQIVERSTKFIIDAILWLTGNAQWSADRVSGTFDDCHEAFSWAHPAYLAIFPG